MVKTLIVSGDELPSFDDLARSGEAPAVVPIDPEIGERFDGERAPELAEVAYWTVAWKRRPGRVAFVVRSTSADCDPACLRLDASWGAWFPRELSPLRRQWAWCTPEEGWSPPGPTQIRGLLAVSHPKGEEKLGNQAAAARALGVARTTVKNWCTGRVEIPYAAWYTLRDLARLRVSGQQ